MSLLEHARAFWTRKRQPGEISDVDRDCKLRVFINDTRCQLVVVENDKSVCQLERIASDNPLDKKSLLMAALEALPPETERRIGNVEVYLDDEEISVVDSRQAKLSHFEGRALAEFGKQQLGGRPVCFASHRYGETSAQETEKRIIAYISEDRLTEVLYALRKLARFTTFFGPWSMQQLLTGSSDETKAFLAIHGGYSTFALANHSAGAVAVRQLPTGTHQLVQAYAAAHGLNESDAAHALRSRSRLAIGSEWPPSPNAPAAMVGTHIALAPVLARMTGEIAATSDYFEFQRLAGRAPELNLFLLGAQVAGFAGWLADMLHIRVQEIDQSLPPASIPPALNLLEGMRTGLLKIGNQHYDFVDGRFAASATAVSSKGTATSRSDVIARWKSTSSQPVTLAMLRPLRGPFFAAAAMVIAIGAGYSILLKPIAQENQNSVNLYSSLVTRLDQAEVPATQASAEPKLWARDMLSVSAAMPYDMKLKRIALVAGPANIGPTVEISGALSKGGGENLGLIGRFMGRLSSSPALRHRLTGVTFAGTGKGDSEDGDEVLFKIVAKAAARTVP